MQFGDFLHFFDKLGFFLNSPWFLRGTPDGRFACRATRVLNAADKAGSRVSA